MVMHEMESHYSDPRFFEFPDSSNQKLFLIPLDFLWSDFYPSFLEILIFQTQFSFPRRFEKSVFVVEDGAS